MHSHAYKAGRILRRRLGQFAANHTEAYKVPSEFIILVLPQVTVRRRKRTAHPQFQRLLVVSCRIVQVSSPDALIQSGTRPRWVHCFFIRIRSVPIHTPLPDMAVAHPVHIQLCAVPRGIFPFRLCRETVLDPFFFGQPLTKLRGFIIADAQDIAPVCFCIRIISMCFLPEPVKTLLCHRCIRHPKRPGQPDFMYRQSIRTLFPIAPAHLKLRGRHINHSYALAIYIILRHLAHRIFFPFRFFFQPRCRHVVIPLLSYLF